MARPFFDTLRELRAGRTHEELTSALAEVLSAVRAAGKPGEVILRLKLRPPKKGGLAYITIEDDVTVKVPKQDRGDTVFFPTVDGGLSRQDPSQLDLALRVVDQHAGTYTEGAGGQRVDSETGEISPARSA
jgi:hypothetical protein